MVQTLRHRQCEPGNCTLMFRPIEPRDWFYLTSEFELHRMGLAIYFNDLIGNGLMLRLQAGSRIRFYIAVAITIVCTGVAKGQTNDTNNKEELQKKIAEVCSKHKVPSMTIAAIRPDKVLLTLCGGVRKRDAKSQVEITDIHPLGSNGKAMTATLAAVIVESGKIKWETTIEEVWPNRGKAKLHPKLRDVTLTDLLTHQSGLRRDFGGPQWASFFAEKRQPAAERRRMLPLALKDEPEQKRGTYLYSNLGYVVAAAMLEERTDKNFESLMQKHIFAPLKMESAYFHTRKAASKLKPPHLWGHQTNGIAISPKQVGSENPSVYSPVGTIHATISDYAKFAQWHLRRKPEPILEQQATLDFLQKGHIQVGGATKYGGGWLVQESPWGKALQHTGSNTNSFALTWVFLEKDLAAIALTNTYEPSHFAACDEMILEMAKRYAK